MLRGVGEFAIFAARSFDMPLSFRASYCFSFFTFDDLPPGMTSSSVDWAGIRRVPTGIPVMPGVIERRVSPKPDGPVEIVCGQ